MMEMFVSRYGKIIISHENESSPIFWFRVNTSSSPDPVTKVTVSMSRQRSVYCLVSKIRLATISHTHMRVNGIKYTKILCRASFSQTSDLAEVSLILRVSAVAVKETFCLSVETAAVETPNNQADWSGAAA